VFTVIGPLVAPVGTVALIVLEPKTKNVLLVPLNVTLLTFVKPEPLMVTLDPTTALVGVNELITGGSRTTKVEGLVALPAGVTTLT
jgi:hypothetical protein